MQPPVKEATLVYCYILYRYSTPYLVGGGGGELEGGLLL